MSVEFEYDIEIEGHTIKAQVNADGRVYQEMYGEDADGNRGEMRTQLDDLSIVITDSHGKDITAKLEKKHKRIFDDIEEEAENKLYEAYDETKGGREYEPDDET